MLDLYYLPIFNTRELDSITHRQISGVTDGLIDKPSECYSRHRRRSDFLQILRA
jgi:hypothetical protein